MFKSCNIYLKPDRFRKSNYQRKNQIIEEIKLSKNQIIKGKIRIS